MQCTAYLSVPPVLPCHFPTKDGGGEEREREVPEKMNEDYNVSKGSKKLYFAPFHDKVCTGCTHSERLAHSLANDVMPK